MTVEEFAASHLLLSHWTASKIYETVKKLQEINALPAPEARIDFYDAAMFIYCISVSKRISHIVPAIEKMPRSVTDDALFVENLAWIIADMAGLFKIESVEIGEGYCEIRSVDSYYIQYGMQEPRASQPFILRRGFLTWLHAEIAREDEKEGDIFVPFEKEPERNAASALKQYYSHKNFQKKKTGSKSDR